MGLVIALYREQWCMGRGVVLGGVVHPNSLHFAT